MIIPFTKIPSLLLQPATFHFFSLQLNRLKPTPKIYVYLLESNTYRPLSLTNEQHLAPKAKLFTSQLAVPVEFAESVNIIRMNQNLETSWLLVERESGIMEVGPGRLINHEGRVIC